VEHEYILEFHGINKSFSGVRALNDISFKIEKGKVHALLGENGAGKSTLMKILSGAYTRDSGEIFYQGKLTQIRNPADSEKLGIAIIYQELNLIPELSVAENIFLRRYPKRGKFINWKQMYEDAREILQRMNVEIDVKAVVSKLSIAQQQMIEIAKSISLDSNVLIMDEPTSALTEGETRKLFQLIENLRKQGITMIYISHRMEEIFEICDTYTVMRDGACITSGEIKAVTVDQLIAYMVGRSLEQVFPQKDNVIGEVVLEAGHLTNGAEVKDVSFYLKKGEILGFAGLVGAGRTETLKVLFGADKKGKGTIKINGKGVNIRSPQDAIAYGIGLVPEDRKKEGLVTELSVLDNVIMAKTEKAMTNGFFSIQKARHICMDYIKDLLIKTPSERQLAKYLSGGNQQKVVLAKWLNCAPNIIFLDEPTRGIDINAKMEIYNIITELAKSGKSIVLVSSEMQEIIGLCDRVYVMCEGEITGTLRREELTQQKIMLYATGGK